MGRHDPRRRRRGVRARCIAQDGVLERPWFAAHEAEGHYTEALDLAQLALAGTRDRVERAAWLASMGELYESVGEVLLAEDALRRSLRALDDTDFSRSMTPRILDCDGVRARALTALARVCTRRRIWDEASAYSQRALEIAQESPHATPTTLAFAFRNAATIRALRAGSTDAVLDDTTSWFTDLHDRLQSEMSADTTTEQELPVGELPNETTKPLGMMGPSTHDR